MLDHIGDQLAHGPVEQNALILVERNRIAGVVELNGDAETPARLFRQLLDRRFKPQLEQRRRAQVLRKLARRSNGRLQQSENFLD